MVGPDVLGLDPTANSGQSGSNRTTRPENAEAGPITPEMMGGVVRAQEIQYRPSNSQRLQARFT